MKLYIEMDVYAQIIDVPAHIVERKDYYRNKFLDWIYNPKTKHNYRMETVDASGNVFVGLCYDGNAFVDWLNRKVLKLNGEVAVMLESDIEIDECFWKSEGMPFIFF